MKRLLHSSKFWLAVYGLIQTIVLYYLEVPQEIIIAVDSLVAVVIAGNAYEDANK